MAKRRKKSVRGVCKSKPYMKKMGRAGKRCVCKCKKSLLRILKTSKCK